MSTSADADLKLVQQNGLKAYFSIELDFTMKPKVLVDYISNNIDLTKASRVILDVYHYRLQDVASNCA